MIKKRIKMQLKSRFHVCGNGFVWNIVRSPSYRLRYVPKMGKCLFLQKVRLPDPMTRPKKNKGEDAEDGEITGSTEKTDDTEETKTSGTGKTVPEIWNREWPSNVDLPSSYDYREHERAPKIGNQGSLGTCWAFASLTALESTLLPKQKETFSVDHMSMHNHFLLGQDEGRIHHVYGVSALLGRPCMGVGRSLWRWFLARWFKSQGTCPGDTDTAVKRLRSDQKAVYLEGGVQSSLYTSMRDYESESVYYNRDTNSYCYIGTEKPNHDSVIVGWDDDYPKENFNMELEGDGAFICTNSWGENFGDQGYFTCPIMIRISGSIILYTRELSLQTIMTTFIKVICVDG